ncbi:hypothetical protein L195_g039903 [Trifolium pratense]|uniref:RNase H type-1 domain-containing protein n=1 Tax=Trifolium pratense TaxID=57577 RepID=A0A2K3LZ95_TRIPR|nr:hypothetical protein L195_g039903 [Trifolium pratense]
MTSIYCGHGGLLRDNNDTCLDSYVHKIGSCNTLHAEMWDMCIEVDLAQRQGNITHLRVESDLKILVDMVTRNYNANEIIPTLIWCICDLMNMN